MKYLFDLPYDKSDPFRIIKNYFDLMYNDDLFLNAAETILKKNSFMRDGVYCFFPDLDSYEISEHFDGVEFAIGYPPSEANSIIVGEDIFYKYIQLACERYLNLHPNDKEKIELLLSKIPN